jgi:hypothetical protein
VKFNATANNANTNDGTPQVSILASASAKRMQERRRQSRLFKNAKGMGAGKKYPGVGTHHRNTKHVWLFSELAEVSAAYKEHHTTMPCWKIADMLYYSFSEQLQYYDKKQNQNQNQDQDQDQPIAQLQEPRIHLPTIQAIQAKLLDCITLQYNETFGYASSQPSQMHKQVWGHLELAEKHRDMLKRMTAAAVPVSAPAPAPAPAQIKEEPEPEQDKQINLNPHAPIWNVHPTSFYTPDAEIEAAEPLTKRRKVMFEDEEVQDESPNVIAAHVIALALRCPPITTAPAPASKTDFDAGIAELVSLMGEADDARRQERTLIQRLVGQIREHNDHIGSLVSNIKDSHAEIEHHREAIARKMQQIETIILPVPLPTPAAATATATAAATTAPLVCAKCTKTIEGELGGFSVSYADPSQPQGTYECYECAPMSPSSRAYFERAEDEYFEMGRAIEEGNGVAHTLDYDSDMDDYPGLASPTEYYDFEEESI